MISHQAALDHSLFPCGHVTADGMLALNLPPWQRGNAGAKCNYKKGAAQDTICVRLAQSFALNQPPILFHTQPTPARALTSPFALLRAADNHHFSSLFFFRHLYVSPKSIACFSLPFVLLSQADH